MKSMNRKEGKKIAVMAAVIVGLMMFAFMPLASAEVTSFAVTPSTGLVGAVDSYNMLVTTDGVSGINITIPAGFIAVAPTTGGVLLAEVNFWNSTKKTYYGHATITSNDTNWTEQVKVYCEFGGDSITTIQNVNYTAGATTAIESGFTVENEFSIDDTSSAVIKLPTEKARGSIEIDINCTAFYLDDVMIAIKQFVRNPLNPEGYEFSADGDKSAWVSITGPSGRAIVVRDGVWFVDTNGNHIANQVFEYGSAEGVPLVWDIEGDNGVATFWDGLWFVDTNGDAEMFGYGIADDVPLVGDMNRSGSGDIAVFRGGEWLVDTTGDHVANFVFGFGLPNDVPLVGDFDNNGIDDIAVFRNGTWYVDTTGDHLADVVFAYGEAGDVPLVGDFMREGRDRIAVFRDGEWLVDAGGTLVATLVFGYGIVGDVPLVGIIE